MIDKEEIDDALFWADLHGIARPEFKTIREWLADGGYVPPASPDDDRVSAELETLLDRLADLGIVIASHRSAPLWSVDYEVTNIRRSEPRLNYSN